MLIMLNIIYQNKIMKSISNARKAKFPKQASHAHALMSQ